MNHHNDCSSEQTKLLNEQEAAHLLGIDAKTLKNWRYKGKGPIFIKFGVIRYRMSDINNFINNSEVRRIANDSLEVINNDD